MSLSIEVSLASVALNCTEFTRGVDLANYELVLGAPTRTDSPGPPPPYGHRNNVLHYYDELGIVLREHHSSRLIEGIDVILDPSRWRFATNSRYCGVLSVFGVDVHSGMKIGEFLDRSPVAFRPHLGHAWYWDGERITIQFEVSRTKGRKPSQRDVISILALGFVGAHRCKNNE